MEKAISFVNQDGYQLVGIHHVPDIEISTTGILFVHAGIQGRLGNTNQYVYYARQFSQIGFHCLRFDPCGFGDSGGYVEECNRRDFYGSVQTGRCVADVNSAIDEFRRYGISNVVLFGLCGGAITALLTGAYHKAVSGMILMSCPVVLDGANIDYNQRISKDIAKKESTIYLRKIFNIKAIWRFLTFQSDYRRVYNQLRAAISSSPPILYENIVESTSGISKACLNKYFFDAMSHCRKKNILWVFGSNDNFWYYFKGSVSNKRRFSEFEELHLVQNGNHMFTLPEWQQEIFDNCSSWLTRKGFCK